MEIGLKGKVVLVTGASRGIGSAIAESLGAHGAKVIINYINSKEKAEETLHKIKSAGGEGIVYKADVRNAKEVNDMVDTAIKTYGHIDALVNNANINFPIKPFISLTWDEIHAKIAGEMAALYNCSQAVLRDMLPRKSGKLVFISSGLSRHPGYGFSAHSAAKSAVDSIAKVMAVELGPEGITVNVVGPGLVRTDATAGQPAEMQARAAEATPLRRIGEPEDIAGVTVFLCSNLSDFVTGEYFPVNGGAFML